MIKSLVTAAALTISLAGYAFAQNTTTGAPAGTTPETPAPGTPLPIPGMMPAPTESHMHHHVVHHHVVHHVHHHVAAPAEAPK
jgi:hypothetical protein